MAIKSKQKNKPTTVIFQAKIQQQRYYNDDSCFGVYVFATQNEIPEYDSLKPLVLADGSDCNIYMSILSGNMQQLIIGNTYEVEAELIYNNKYKSWQYQLITVKENMEFTEDNQRNYLLSILTENQVNNLLSVYPDIVERVISNNEIDISKVKGIGEAKWENCKAKIIENYNISDILTMLSPLGVTYNMVKKLVMSEEQPELLKQKLLKNPYMMTKIKGLGFKRVDDLALKLKPELKQSIERIIAFTKYYFISLGENEGHTYVRLDTFKNEMSNNIPECMSLYDDFINSQKRTNLFLHFSGNKVGLKEYYDNETAVLGLIEYLSGFKPKKIENYDEIIKRVEKEQGFNFNDEQIEVINRAINQPVVLITGKAGSGKTSITKALLSIFSENSLNVSCCALSAKAAQRITEATGFPASTIHRLLQCQGDEFSHNKLNPLPCDVLLVDEFSMINTKIALVLMSAVKEGTRVIICGDNRQLPPIGYGNIFNDLLNLKNHIYSVYKLTKVHRQAEDSGILVDANKIRDGIDPIPIKEIRVESGKNKDMVYRFGESREGLRRMAIKSYLNAVKTNGLDNVVIITPRKDKCINSVTEINNIIQENLIPNSSKEIKYINQVYKVGAKIIQRVNNYEKEVFNGEIGTLVDIIFADSGNINDSVIKCEYKNITNEKEKRTVEYEYKELEQIQLAYALTVHLSQGSGYNCVIAIIDNTDYILLDNCLLYTALTRAKKKCLLLAEPSAYKRAIKTNHTISRQTWLSLMNED